MVPRKNVFGSNIEVFFVFNGTAANVLSLKTITKPHQAIFCTEVAHIQNDECGAPEAITGCKLLSLPHQNGKLTSQSLAVAERKILDAKASIPHQVQPKTLSMTQSTELGTVYSISETKMIADFAHKHGMLLHMDGARISNAVAKLDVSLKEATIDAGLDVLSFGGTKNGLLGVDAIVFFRPELAQDFVLIRKQNLQLASKMRFFSVQFDALLTNELWKENAQHANRMASILAEGLLKIPGITITRPVEANAVFAVLPKAIIPELKKKFYFYDWDGSTGEARLMTSFNTSKKDIEAFLEETLRLAR